MNERKCLACGGNEFSTRDVLMSTAGLTFIGLDWINPTVTAYTCTQCGYVMLYAQVAPKHQEPQANPDQLEEERKRAIESFVKAKREEDDWTKIPMYR
jgi:predicted nucleic-acid-binding Zn-ribbon protein